MNQEKIRNEILKNTETKEQKQKFKKLFPEQYTTLLDLTGWLPITTPLAPRRYVLLHNITSTPLCGTCAKEVEYAMSSKSYPQYCSYKCSNANINTQNKKKASNIAKYGHTNFLASSSGKQKIQKFLDDNNVINVSQIPEVQKKRDDTFNERYGGHPLTNSTIREKINNTIKERYGVDNISQLYSIKQKKEDTCIKKFGYSNNSQINTHKVHHLLKDELWLKDQYETKNKPLSLIAKELHIDLTTISYYIDLFNIPRRYTFSQSGPEIQIIEFLKQHNVVNIVENTYSLIYPQEIDIYLPDYKIAIEHCGIYWHCNKHNRIYNSYHKQKMDKCNKLGIRLITIFEDEWIHKQDIVKSKLLSILNIPSSQNVIYARNCQITEVSTSDKVEFYEKYHIQGDGPSSINYGLVCDNILIACMGFIKQKDNKYILNRFASSTHIPGGFSKLLSHFKNNTDWKKIITFADLRWSIGQLYLKNNFILDKKLPPDYEYVDTNNIKRIHKFNFRHKQLKKILGNNYDLNLSESENTFNNKIFKIYNCGLLRFILKNE